MHYIAIYSCFDIRKGMSKKVTTTIYITEKQQEGLKELNEKTKIPVAEFIRQGIDLILKKYEEQLSGQLSLPIDKKDKPLKK